MFDAVRNNKRIVQGFLVLITLPFAFWGVDSYVHNTGAGNDVAKVGNVKITQQQYQEAWRDQQQRLRQMMGASFDPAMMDSPEAKQAVLNSLIDRSILLQEAAKNRLSASDNMLRDIISKIPALQENGQFSMDRYEAALKAQGLTQAGFEAQMRQDITLQQLASAISDTGMVSSSVVDALLRIQSEERLVSELRIPAAQFADKVKPTDEDLKKYYDQHKAAFKVPEELRAEYVQLSLDTLLPQITIKPEDVKSWYDSHKERFQQPEERRASHILIMVDAKASPADKAKAKAKAEAVLKEVQQNPGKFADIAKRDSQDPGSAAKGGDLGFFAKGAMVKPFDDAVFKLKDGQLSGLVQSDFGYHIIKLTGIKAGKVASLDEVKGQIETELKKQEASRKFAEMAEAFSNTVYEQADSLKPAADKFKLTVQQSGWLTRQANPANGMLGNAKLLGALFGDDAVKNKRNTDAVEVAPNTLVAARVVEYKPASMKTFESVKAQLLQVVKAQQMADLAKKAGEAQLAALQKGEGAKSGTWTPARAISRLNGSQMVPPPALQAIFKAKVAKLPAYAGATFPNGVGYVIYRIEKVSQPEKLDETKRQQLHQEYTNLSSQEDFGAYLSALRSRYKVVINKSALENPNR